MATQERFADRLACSNTDMIVIVLLCGAFRDSSIICINMLNCLLTVSHLHFVSSCALS